MSHIAKNSARSFSLAILGGVLLTSMSGSSRAADRFTCSYTGTCYGFHAETHMVEALHLMNEAAYAPRHLRIRLTQQAMNELRTAEWEVRSRRAEYLLDDARHHLRHFMRHGDLQELKIAANSINRAIRAEHLVRGYGRRHRPHAGPTTAPVVVHPYPVYGGGRSSLSFGSRWGQVRIQF